MTGYLFSHKLLLLRHYRSDQKKRQTYLNIIVSISKGSSYSGQTKILSGYQIFLVYADNIGVTWMKIHTIRGKWIGFFLLLFLTGLCMGASIIFGYTDTSIKTTIDSFINYNGSNEHIIIQTVRIPRALIGACVGASLAIAGAIMQVLTRNSLASPDILGVNSGASFFIVFSVTVFSVQSLDAFIWISFLGAAVASTLVYGISLIGKDGLSPLKITLAGVAIAAFFASMTQGLLAADEAALDQMIFWLAGSVANRDIDILITVFPYLLIAWIGSLLMAKKMNVLLLGDDISTGLGQKTLWVKICLGVLVVLLAGGSVAIAGPIGFVGITVPHIARSFVGNDYRFVIPYCACLGAILLLVADTLSRYIIMPEEVAIGVMTAIIGAPFFIYIARKEAISR